MTNTFEFGDIFIFRFPFTSGELSKPRPALVLFQDDPDYVICPVTSVLRAGKSDVAIQSWREVGLEKPSFIRLNRLLTVERKVLTRRIGKLGEADFAAVKLAWNSHMVLR
jgi:mRNA interferase MazF